MAETKDNKTVGLDPAMLTELIKTIMAEARKPTELEQEELEAKKAEREAKRAQIEQDQRTRQETAQQKLQEIEARAETQRICSHENRRGDTHIVFVKSDPLGGYLLCQKCQAIIRPEIHRKNYPSDYGGTIIFDNVLFNRLIQKTSDGSSIID